MASAVVSGTGLNLFLTALHSVGNSTDPGVFMSPLSIIYALALALNGAGARSSTHAELFAVLNKGVGGGQQQQLLSELEYNSLLAKLMAQLIGESCPAPAGASAAPGEQAELVLANSIWTRSLKLENAYATAMQTLYKATAREATRGAADVNAWVEQATKGKIKNLITNNDFAAVLANAIYFKGLWQHAFTPMATRDREFTTAAGAVKEVPMMHQTFEASAGILGARKEGSYDAVVLPYKGGTFSAVAILPADGVAVDAVLKQWPAASQTLEPLGRVLVGLPKFKVESSISLVPVLKELGVKAAFMPGSADFTRMASETVYVSDVVHKAVVEVDEEGTVAAAATAVVMTRSMPMPPPQIVFDRPFVFVILHAPTQLPVFMGVVNDPGSAQAHGA